MAEVKRAAHLPDDPNPNYNPSFVGRKDGNHNGPTAEPTPAAAVEQPPAKAAQPAALPAAPPTPAASTPASALAVDPIHLKYPDPA